MACAASVYSSMSQDPRDESQLSERAPAAAEGADRELYPRWPAGGFAQPVARFRHEPLLRHHPQCDGRSRGLRLVSSPHTSAGRVPTPKGYRFFIDTLLQVQPLERIAADEMRLQFQAADDPRALVSMASQLLSNVTQMAGVVSLQPPKAASLTHIEFLPLVGTARARDPGVRRTGRCRTAWCTWSARYRRKTCGGRRRH